MSKGPENGCPEPVYPRELRSSSYEPRFERVVDWGSEGEGTIVFDASTPRILYEELGRLPRSSARAWIDDRSKAYAREVAYEVVTRGIRT